MIFLQPLVTLLILFACSSLGKKTIATSFTYYLDGDSIDWDSRHTKSIFASSGRYTPRNIIPTRFQSKAYEAVICFPRLRPGVPITLGKIKLKFGDRHPEIKPFPSWEFQQEGSCDAIQNAVDVYLDPFNVLWVLDTGVVNTLELPIRRCRPKVWGIHFKTGKVLHEIDLSPFCYPSSRLQYIVADCTVSGDKFLYISDAESSSLLVCDVTAKRCTRIQLPIFTTNGRSKDILYIFLLKPKRGDRMLGFTFLSGTNLYFIKTSSLQSGHCRTIADFGEKPAEIVPLGTDNGGVLYFRYKVDPKIYAWDSCTPFREPNFKLVDKGNECRLSTQVAGGSRLLMWSLDSNFQDFINGMCGSVGASASIRPLVANEKK